MLGAIKRSVGEELWTLVKGHCELESGGWRGGWTVFPPPLWSAGTTAKPTGQGA